MSHTLVETADPASFGGVTVPDDGDPLVVASVNGAFAAMANRTGYLLGQVPSGLLIGGETAAAHRDGTFDIAAFSVVIDGKRYASPAATVPADPGFDGVLGSGLGWWYLYADIGLGTLALKWSTTPPDASGTWKAGAEDVARYLACAFSDAAGKLYPMTKCGREYRWGLFYQTPTAHLSGGTGAVPGAWTTVSMSPTPAASRNPCMPPHGRIVHVEVQGGLVGADVGATCRLMVRTEAIAGETSWERSVLWGDQGADALARGSFSIGTTAANTIDMRSEGFTGAGGWSVDFQVVGFTAP